MSYSIRQRLLKYLVGAHLATSILIATLTYFVARKEMNELYDKNMQQIAIAILAQHDADHFYPRGATNKAMRLEGEEEFLIQIWKHDTLLYTSHPSIALAQQPRNGYGSMTFNDQKWRYFKGTKDDINVQLSQSIETRQEPIREVSSNLVIPLLVQIPLLGIFIWIMLGRGLRPIRVVSSAIEARSSQALHPLHSDDLPLEIKPLVLALNELLERLDHALKAQRRFTADAAHELRTPLTAVQLQLDLLKRSKSKQDRTEGLERLGDGIKRSIHTVRQLLTLAHQEPGAGAKTMKPLDLTAFVMSTVQQYDVLAKQKSIALKVRVPDSASTILGNEDALKTMLENLLDNAIRYTHEGGRIEVRLAHGTLTIADNGVGIPEAERARVFDRFYRILGTGESGTGLGLAIVREIVQQHHATIELSDGLDGKGLSVDIHFLKLRDAEILCS